MVPKGSLGIEAFVHGGRDYTYFGLFPSLIRLPVLAFTHAYDGRLTAPSMLSPGSSRGSSRRCSSGGPGARPWRRGDRDGGGRGLGGDRGRAHRRVGPGLSGPSPKVSHEDLAWSVALTVAAVFALLGVLERPSWRRVRVRRPRARRVARPGTDRVRLLPGSALIAGWFALAAEQEHVAAVVLPMALVGVVPLTLMGLINWLKLGTPFGLSEADQVWTQVNLHRRQYLAASDGSGFGLQFLPSTLTAYLQPGGLHFQSASRGSASHGARPHGRPRHPRRHPAHRQFHRVDAPDLPARGLGHDLCVPARPIGRVALTRVLRSLWWPLRRASCCSATWPTGTWPTSYRS